MLLVKKTTLYAERDEKKRAEYLEEISELKSSEIVYIDESGIDDNIYREYARSPRGCKVFFDIKGKKSQRLSIIAALVGKEIVAPFVFEGYTNSDVFNMWLKVCLIPLLKEGQTVVMDNASFHKSKETRELIEGAGCKLIFLPPYSPDYNPIEQTWAILKARIRNVVHKFDDFNKAVDYVFKFS